MFKDFDNIDCKIIAFEVKKQSISAPYNIGSTDFEFSWHKISTLHKVEVLLYHVNKLNLKSIEKIKTQK
jgi:hypothetical protein